MTEYNTVSVVVHGHE